MEYKLSDLGAAVQENNDCAVQALAIASDTPYWQILALLSHMGRKPRHGTKVKLIAEAVGILGLRPARPVNKRITLARFVKAFPTGLYYMHSKRHAWAVKDGIVFDSWKVGPKTRILYFAKNER